MIDPNKKILTAVVPISAMAGNLEYLQSWVPLVKSTQISVIIVHDRKDEETTIALQQFLSEINSPYLQILEGHFGAPGKARNFGLEKVQTEWVIFWDSDDLPFVQVQLEAVLNARKTSNVLVSNYETLNMENNEIVISKKPKNIVDLGSQAGIWRYAFKTELAKMQLFGTFCMGEDQIFLARLNLNWENIEFTNKTSYRYIKGHKFQLTGNALRINWLENTIDEYLSENSNFIDKNEFSVTIGIRLMITLIKNGNIKQKLRGIKKFGNFFVRNKLGIIRMSTLTTKVLIKAVFNV